MENMIRRCTKNGKLSMEDAVKIYQKVLEDLVEVNSLFTTAVFLGLSLASSGQHSFRQSKNCDADKGVAKSLLVSEVIAFGCYLLSSLVAKALKVHLTTYLILKTKLLRKRVVTLLFFLSTWGFILGCLFLTLSMVNIIQIRLGKISCEGSYTLQAAVSLITIVSPALLFYIMCMMCTMVSFFCKCE